ncbi:MAG: HNH endonuclease [Sphingomonas sp.]|nr:HNH endonuclease [Sphingomonas sp.]
MKRKTIARYLNFWMFQRDRRQREFAELHQRDGDNCWRCKRPMRFDLPRSHPKAPSIEHIMPKSRGGTMALGNLCLCHRRCNWELGDKTPEVKERMRLRAEGQSVTA